MSEPRPKTLEERAKECRHFAQYRPELRYSYLRLAEMYEQLSEVEAREQRQSEDV